MPILFVGLVYPLISKHIFSDFKRTQRFFQKSFNFLTISGVLLTVIAFFLASQIINIVGGAEFTYSVIVLQILSLSFLPYFLASLTGIVFAAVHKQKYLILPLIIFAAVNIASNAIFIPRYSFYGSAVVTTIGQILVCLIYFWLIAKHTKLIPNLNIIPKTLVAGIISGGFLFWLKSNNFLMNWAGFDSYHIWQKLAWMIILSLLIFVIYFAFLYLFNGIKKEDLQGLKQG